MPRCPSHALLAALSVAACAGHTPRRAPAEPAPVYLALVGRWEGTLEYRDYREPTRRVTLPTVLEVTPAAEGVVLAFTYDDGPGKIVRSRDRLMLEAGGRAARWGGEQDTTPQTFAVVAWRGGSDAQPTRLVLEGEGRDDNAPATIRETISVGPAALRVLKETRPSGGAFAFRHEYVFRRVP